MKLILTSPLSIIGEYMGWCVVWSLFHLLRDACCTSGSAAFDETLCGLWLLPMALRLKWLALRAAVMLDTPLPLIISLHVSPDSAEWSIKK